MNTSFERQQRIDEESRSSLLPILIGGMMLLFFAAPWSLEHKAHAALHGLCAQIPSHTFVLGGSPLPFDARMTGIYGGFAVAFGCLLALGRHRAARLPSFPVMALLTLMVAVMAVDGFNSLLRDIGESHPYQPGNTLRLVTGMGTGVALATILCYLFGVTLWQRPEVASRVLRGRDLAIVLPAQVPFALLVHSGSGSLWGAMTIVLILSAVGVIASLALVAIVLVRKLDYRFERASELQPHAMTAVLLAVIVMASLSGGRFLVEHLTAIQSLP